MHKHPFHIDPFAVVYTAFRNLYPKNGCIVMWDGGIEDDVGKEVYGETLFPEKQATPIVYINPHLSVIDAIEVLAHELAHVAAGCAADHDEEWEKAFDAIYMEYNRIMRIEFPGAKPQ